MLCCGLLQNKNKKQKKKEKKKATVVSPFKAGVGWGGGTAETLMGNSG